MLFPIVSLAVTPGPTAATLNTLAQKRDVVGLSKYLLADRKLPRNPFDVIRTGGAYGVGRFGWSAGELDTPSGKSKLVVFSTPLTVEDIGELLMKRVQGKLKYVPETDTLGVRILRHSFVVRFKTEAKSVDIVDRATFSSMQLGGDFVTRMAPAYRVASVTDESGRKVEFHQSGGIVSLPRPSHHKFVYAIHYGGQIDMPGYAGSVSTKEATLTDDYWYPTIARLPAPYDIEVHAPSGWTVVAQGEQISATQKATESVARFSMNLPVTYYSLSAAPYQITKISEGGKSYRVWSLRMKPDAMEIAAEKYPAIIDFFSKFAPYPFSSYGAVDSAAYGGGALEAYSFATFGGDVEGSQVHELSHTWWGGTIDNTYLHSFWNESFADFSDGLYHRNVPIGNVAEKRVAFIEDGQGEESFDTAPVAYGPPDLGPVADALGYGKGAKVLQMLEQILGTPRMIKTMRDWITVHPKGAPGEWEEYISVVELSLKEMKLDSFFRDWLYRPGYARLNATATYTGKATRIALSWTGPRFRMPLLVMTENEQGKRIFRTFDTAKGDIFLIPGVKPALVSIDPYRQALRDVDISEIPVQLDNVTTTLKIVDSAHPDWLPGVRPGSVPSSTSDLDGAFIVGSPETLPMMRPLCDKVGFVVHGSQLTYDKTTIDLNKGAAMAVVELGEGKRCVIGLGKVRGRMEFGRARLALMDDLGRFVRGVTDPKTKGKLTFKL